MNIGIVRMLMRKRFMPMPVRMHPLASPRKIVCVLMMRIMLVAMAMLERLVRVLVFMAFPKVQP